MKSSKSLDSRKNRDLISCTKKEHSLISRKIPKKEKISLNSLLNKTEIISSNREKQYIVPFKIQQLTSL